jgi:hypothetical protein
MGAFWGGKCAVYSHCKIHADLEHSSPEKRNIYIYIYILYSQKLVMKMLLQ